MFVDRILEQSRFREAILARRSLLLYGPPDSGKSALLYKTLSSLPATVRRNCIVCRSCENPRSVWRDLIRSLAEVSDPQVLSRVERECSRPGSLERWLDAQSSLRLRGILRHAMRERAYCVFLDTRSPLPDGVYRLLQEWVWSGCTPVFLLARGATESEIGRPARLFWNQGLRLQLGPLQSNDLHILFQACILRFCLTSIANEEFRHFVLERCAGLPGKIVRLCELASHDEYRFDGRLKLHTLAVDFLMQTQNMQAKVLRATHNG
jgi:hypothetical protein